MRLTEEQRTEVERQFPRVLTLARKFSRDDEYEGIASEALIDAVRTFDPAHGVAIDDYVSLCVYRRMHRARKAAYEEQSRRRPLYDVAVEPSPDAERVIASLPPSLRAIAELHFVGGIARREIALLLGIKPLDALRRIVEAKRLITEEVLP